MQPLWPPAWGCPIFWVKLGVLCPPRSLRDSWGTVWPCPRPQGYQRGEEAPPAPGGSSPAATHEGTLGATFSPSMSPAQSGKVPGGVLALGRARGRGRSAVPGVHPTSTRPFLGTHPCSSHRPKTQNWGEPVPLCLGGGALAVVPVPWAARGAYGFYYLPHIFVGDCKSQGIIFFFPIFFFLPTAKFSGFDSWCSPQSPTLWALFFCSPKCQTHVRVPSGPTLASQR